MIETNETNSSTAICLTYAVDLFWFHYRNNEEKKLLFYPREHHVSIERQICLVMFFPVQSLKCMLNPFSQVSGTGDNLQAHVPAFSC